MTNRKSLQVGRQTGRIMPAVFMSRMLITIFVLLVVSGVFCGSAAADNPDVQTAQNLSDALNLTTDSGDGAAYVNGAGKVVLLQDVWLNYTINITAQDSITLTANESNDFTIYRDFGNGYLFTVSSGIFILEGNNGHNLTIDGNKTAYSSNGNSLVYVDGGELNMSAGSVLQNSITPYYGGGVFMNSGIFNLTGGTIFNNTADYGGGVYVCGGTFTMNGGTISSNTAASYGGGVDVKNSGTFTMNGGTISGNTAYYYGGGVLMSGGTFNMDGGTISNNTANIGCGVYVDGGTVNMTGGTISGNNANRGGGVFMNDGTFNMSGSAIVNLDNDVYLATGTYINVTGILATDTGAKNITPAFNGIGARVVEYGSVDRDDWASNFALNTIWALENSRALTNTGSNLSLIENITVNFYLDEVSNVEYSTITNLRLYDTISEPSTPAKPGYTFNGWNITNASGTSWNFSTDNVFGYTQLYANWTVNPTPTPTPTPTSSENEGNGGNDDNNADFGPVSANGIFTTNDGGLTLHYPAGSSIIVTVFRDYFNGAAAPSGVSYLNVYDVHSTADSGTSVTLVFRVNASLLENKGLTPEDISILRYNNNEWERMTITSIERVDGEHLFTVTSDRTSVFMIACNVDGSWFPLEEAEETSTPTTGPTLVEPAENVPTINPTKAASSPVPVLGIIAGLVGMALLTRRE